MPKITIILLVLIAKVLTSCATDDTKARLSVPIWHTLTLDFKGPRVAETDADSPFLHYRMDVTFSSPSGESYRVPGFFAADGDAAETGAQAGDVWRVRFSPNERGSWRYRVAFSRGDLAAIDPSVNTSAGFFDGRKGRFNVTESVAGLDEKDFRAQGKLRYVDKRYLQFQQSKDYFLKIGANSPEVFLGYAGFDATPTDRTYPDHVAQWREGDPMWQGDKGKGIIGLVNYLSDLDNNVIYFLLMNADGDGKQVWPWIEKDQTTRFDVSKLAQWKIVFDHMSQRGVMPHFVLTETENEHFFEWYDGKTVGGFSDVRKLYYRELVARFGYLLATTWNVGEENGWADPNSKDYQQNIGNSTEQRKQFSSYLSELLWYRDHIVIHNGPDRDYWIFEKPGDNILGHKAFTGVSLQSRAVLNKAFEDVERFVRLSEASGHPWVVGLDEPFHKHKKPQTLEVWRKYNVWPTFLAGGAGIELYLGGGNDLTVQNLHVYEAYYKTMAVAANFFEAHVPYWEMLPLADVAENGWAFGKAGETYVLYFPDQLNEQISIADGDYQVRWYNPVLAKFEGGAPKHMSARGGLARLELPPGASKNVDWVVLVTGQ